MNPQILRRVEDPCRTQRHMRRGIGIPWEGKGKGNTFRYHSSDKSKQERPFSPTYPTPFPTATEHRVSLGEGHEQATPATSWEQGTTEYRPPPASCAFTISAAGNTVLDVCCGDTRCGISPAVLAHVLGRSCQPPGITALCALSLARADDDASLLGASQ